MTFVSHSVSGGSLHLLISAVLLWLLSLLLAAAGWMVPVWFAVFVGLTSLFSGLYFGAFPDTEDWVVHEMLGLAPRWEIYHRCHVTDLRKRFGWIPGWAWHLFCDRFAHPPKDDQGNPRESKWYEMKVAWKDQHIIFGLTMWDANYVMRELLLLVISVSMLSAGSAIIISVIK